MSSPALAHAPVGVRDVLRLAWPAALSYLLNNCYRINDQYWVQGLGPQAQAALTATMFIAMMNFAVIYLAAGGTLALVARATGAGDHAARERAIAASVWIALAIYAVFVAVGPLLAPSIVDTLNLSPGSADFAERYIATLYVVSLPLVLAPAIDHAYLGIGNALVPSLLELGAVAVNYLLAPILIYGRHAAERVDNPGAALAARIADFLGIEGYGIEGAPLAIAGSRTLSSGLGLIGLRAFYGVRWYAARLPERELLSKTLSIALPVGLAIVAYSAVYWTLIHVVMAPLGEPVLAGLGIGFGVFEGLTFPCFLGIAMAGASLVGRALGAHDRERALSAVRSARLVAVGAGLIASVAFLGIAPRLAPFFSHDAAVVRETIGYVSVIAFSQPLVAFEATNERILLGAGYTRWALWISLLGNGMRIPLAWLLAIRFGLGGLGVWWALNLTTAIKCAWQFALVQRRTWLERGLTR